MGVVRRRGIAARPWRYELATRSSLPRSKNPAHGTGLMLSCSIRQAAETDPAAERNERARLPLAELDTAASTAKTRLLPFFHT